ncbi:MAG TPA: hypothetical protein VLK84_19740 [Longimicrobium sp.]|nr:hypothetical protein [Longimicrobium sp.]
MTQEKVPAEGEARLGTDAREPRRGTLNDSVVLRDGTTLLDYEILPAPNPLQAGAPATLTLVVSNGTHALVTCTAITLTLAVGTNAKDLVASAEGITSQAPAGWSVAQGGGTFTLMPQTPGAGQIGATGLSFVFGGLAVNAQVGTTVVTIGEAASTPSQPPLERTGTIALPKFPAEFTLGDLTAHPLEVSAGDAVTLNWSGGSPATYQLEFNPGNGSQSVPVGSAGPYVASGLTRYPEVVFTLVVSYTVPGQDQPLVAQKQAIVQVDAALPAVTSFGGSVGGGGVTLHWDSSDADACRLNALPTPLNPSGSIPSGNIGPLPPDRIRYSLVAESLRTGTSSAAWNVDLHVSVTRQQPLAASGPLFAKWLMGAGGESTLLAILLTGTLSTSINVVDRASLRITGTLAYYDIRPAMALSRDGTRFFAYTVHQDFTSWLALVAVPSLKVLEVPRRFEAVSAAFSPDGETLYVTSAGPSGVHVLNEALVEQRFFPVPDVGPCAVSDDGSRLYIAGVRSFVVADTATGAILGQPAVGTSGGDILLDGARNRAYVTRTGEATGSVIVVDLAAMTVVGEVGVGVMPGRITMGPSGGEFYVADQLVSSITVVDADALEVITVLDPGFTTDLAGVAIAPGAPLTLYALTSSENQVPVVHVLQVTS